MASTKEFELTFIVARGITFDVSYYTLGRNKTPYFATSANVFNKPRTDYNRCGQCQADVLRDKALDFYKKWDEHHLKDLNEAQYNNLIKDLAELKKIYPHYGNRLGFSSVVELEREFRKA